MNLTEALASFDELYSPRIVTTMNDYDVRIAHTLGDYVWHAHDDTDEFFLVLDGRFDIVLRDGAGEERTVVLERGDVFALREHEWVLIDRASGGMRPEPEWFRAERGYESHDSESELFELTHDLAQRNNRYADEPARAERMRRRLHDIQAAHP
ncbi:MAG: cupin domain-containing protein [Acidimicrobiales bacterium]|nr:cupin domain-containing protein [Acidimicrobiales bacterium]